MLTEQTSGNMGISIAFMAAVKGYKIGHEHERRGKMGTFRADLILIDPT